MTTQQIGLAGPGPLDRGGTSPRHERAEPGCIRPAKLEEISHGLVIVVGDLHWIRVKFGEIAARL